MRNNHEPIDLAELSDDELQVLRSVTSGRYEIARMVGTDDEIAATRAAAHAVSVEVGDRANDRHDNSDPGVPC